MFIPNIHIQAYLWSVSNPKPHLITLFDLNFDLHVKGLQSTWQLQIIPFQQINYNLSNLFAHFKFVLFQESIE